MWIWCAAAGTPHPNIAGDDVQFMHSLAQSAAELIKPMPLNIDGALAALLYDMGCTPLFAKFLFILGRAGRLSAQVMEEYTRERPMRIGVPVEYDGEAPQDAGDKRTAIRSR